MEAIHTYYNGDKTKRLQIFNDEEPMNPREDDNLGTMYCTHGRYSVGDSNAVSANEVRAEVGEGHFISLPVYMYDHSGITVSTTPFGCSWDSGQVGRIYTTTENAADILGVSVEDLDHDKVKEMLVAEVAEYDRYLRGEFYGYMVTDKVEKYTINATDLQKLWDDGMFGLSAVIDESEPHTVWEEGEHNSCWNFHSVEQILEDNNTELWTEEV